MIGYGGHSETERVLVNNEELTTLNWLEIQSGPLGNLGDIHGDESSHAARCGVGRRVKEFGSSAVSNNQSGE